MASASPSRNDNYDYDNMAIANATIPVLRVHADGSLSMCPDEADEDAQKSQKTEASQQAGGKRAAQGTLPEVLEPKPKAKFMASTKAFDFKKALGVTGPGSGGSRGLRQRRGCRSVSDCEPIGIPALVLAPLPPLPLQQVNHIQILIMVITLRLRKRLSNSSSMA